MTDIAHGEDPMADPTDPTEQTSVALSDEDPFEFDLEDVRAEALANVENPIVRAAIERVKHGHVAQGFTNRYDKAYHSHSST